MSNVDKVFNLLKKLKTDPDLVQETSVQDLAHRHLGLSLTRQEQKEIIKKYDKLMGVKDDYYSEGRFLGSIKELKIGASVVLATDYDKGDPMELVPNPNPNGYNKQITRKAAQQWLEYNKGKKPSSSDEKRMELMKKNITKTPYHMIKD